VYAIKKPQTGLFYLACFLALGFLGAAVMAAGFLTADFLAGCFSAADFLGAVVLAAGLTGLSGCAAHSSAVNLCRPTQYPVTLRPQPHLAGSVAGGTMTGVTAGVWGVGSMGASVFLKKLLINRSMSFSYAVFTTLMTI
jgi:hypothetical protein